MAEELKNLSTFVKSRRKALGLSQEAFAERSGLSLTLLRDIERKKANPTLSTLVKIAEVFDMSVAELLDFRNDLRNRNRLAANIIRELKLLPAEKLALMLDFIRAATR